MKYDKDKKNVAIIIGTLYIGGAEKVASLLSRYLVQNGYSVYLFLDHYDGNMTYPHAGKVIRMCTMNTGNAWIDMYYKARFLKERKKRYHIQYSVSFMEEYNFINVLSRADDKVMVSVRIYLSEMKKIQTNEQKKRIKRFELLIPLLYNRTDKVIAITEIGKKDLCRNFGVRKNKIKVIPNPADTTEMPELRSTHKLLGKPIIMIGRYVEQKAQWHMIRAMKEVVHRNADAHLYLLGQAQGSTFGYLKRMVANFGLEDHVHFEGFQSDVYAYLQSARLFVLSSAFEGFPNALLDALVCGIPVISTDCRSGPRDILAPGTSYPERLKASEYAEYGILVPCPDSSKDNMCPELTDSEKCMANTVDRFLNDETLWKYYAGQSRKRAKYYDVTKICQEWASLLDEQSCSNKKKVWIDACWEELR